MACASVTFASRNFNGVWKEPESHRIERSPSILDPLSRHVAGHDLGQAEKEQRNTTPYCRRRERSRRRSDEKNAVAKAGTSRTLPGTDKRRDRPVVHWTRVHLNALPVAGKAFPPG